MRDGKLFRGILRSFDQYMNIVLENVQERAFEGRCYSDFEIGNCIIRGDDITMLGDVDEEGEDEALDRIKMRKVSNEEMYELQAEKDTGGGQSGEGGVDAKLVWDFAEE